MPLRRRWPAQRPGFVILAIVLSAESKKTSRGRRNVALTCDRRDTWRRPCASPLAHGSPDRSGAVQALTLGARHQLGQFLVGEPGRHHPGGASRPGWTSPTLLQLLNVIARFGLIRPRLNLGIRDLASLNHPLTHDNSVLRNTNWVESGLRWGPGTGDRSCGGADPRRHGPRDLPSAGPPRRSQGGRRRLRMGA